MAARLTLPSRMELYIVISIRVHLGADGSGTYLLWQYASLLITVLVTLRVAGTASQSQLPCSHAWPYQWSVRLQFIFLKALLSMPRSWHRLVPVFPMSFKHSSRSFLGPRSQMCHSLYADPSLLPLDIRC